MSIRRFFLYLLILSVALSAALGILIILLGDFGATEMRILGTTTTITVLSILGLTSGAAYESRGNPFVSICGLVSAVIAGAIWIAIIWSNSEGGEYVVKIVLTFTLAAFSFAYASLTSFALLDTKFEWTRLLALLNLCSLAGFLLYIIWFDIPDAELTGRVIGVLSILLGAFSVVLPVLHLMSKGSRDLSQINEEIESAEKRLAELIAERDALDYKE